MKGEGDCRKEREGGKCGYLLEIVPIECVKAIPFIMIEKLTSEELLRIIPQKCKGSLEIIMNYYISAN